MKTTFTILIAAVILLSTGSAIRAESESTEGRPFMGVLIDPAPLPQLLSKHLGLPFGQGLRIQNVQKGSPADKTGLERDDLIIGFQGDDVHDYQRFVDSIRQAGSGTEVSVQIIHLGVRKTVKLTLRPFEGQGEWKHPREPQAVQSWRPGRFFRLQPGDEDWKEMFKDGFPPDIDIDVKRFFNEVRTYHHSNGEDYTVTIEGNPNDEDSTITVRIGDDEYTTTVKEIDKLPKKCREVAEKSLENARKAPRPGRFRNRRFDIDVLPWRTPPDWRGYFDRLYPRNYPFQPFDRGEEMVDKIEKQMRDLRERLEQQEQRYRERFEKLEKYYDRISPKREEKDSEEPKESIEPTGTDGQKA
ncbi:MAG: PDZ domain-containing protein [Phycisphaerales bacterium]|nr:MAG: PDZ domain-containing protein [Phycisphaerales bacterium]